MAKSNDSNKGRAATKGAARHTDSGPSKAAANPSHDASAKKLAQTGDMVAGMPFNANKPLEHGFQNGLNPQAGATVRPQSRLPTGSTLTEETGTTKTGRSAAEGVNATVEPLDRVRVDSAGQVLTTNQGVAIADNQNSLKMGLRGPALLEDFILREKLTHFDHERIPERIVHARGSAAHGFFEAYEPLTEFTKAICANSAVTLRASSRQSSKFPSIWMIFAPCITAWASLPRAILPCGTSTAQVIPARAA